MPAGERRMRRSQPLTTKLCPECRRPMRIDSVLIQLERGGGAWQACPGCGSRVPVRPIDFLGAAPLVTAKAKAKRAGRLRRLVGRD